MTIIFGKTFRTALLFIVLAELLSIFGYLVPVFNKTVFFAIIGLVLVLSLQKLEYGLLVAFSELFIGSKGYLFSFDSGGSAISIRIALWLVIMAVWFGQSIVRWTRNRKVDMPVFKSEFFPYYGALFIFLAWGLANGFIRRNGISDVFFDFNGWLYFALLFPVSEAFYRWKQDGKTELMVSKTMQVLAASTAWVALKTFVLLFIFSHGMVGMFDQLYRWVRVTGVGEITQMQGGFYRIFIQSHIFVLIVFFILFLIAVDEIRKGGLGSRRFWQYFFASSVSLSVIIVGLSRSFWVGLLSGLFLAGAYMLRGRFGWKAILQASLSFIVMAAAAVILIIAAVKFPYPKPIGGFDATDLLSDRAVQVSGEAGASSRWALLPELMKKIRISPVLGGGFGSTVTYISQDPRILQSSAKGEYTTYAFEWGWLDIWLKLGLFGLAAYAALIGKVFITGMAGKAGDGNEAIITGLSIGLAVVSAVSFFSPYTNHPLGIGYLIIAGAVISANKK